MSKGKLKINGKRLKDIIALTGHTQKEIDEYFGFSSGIKNYIARGEIPVSIKDALEYHFAINYEDYAKSDSGCRCCDENNLQLLGWSYCPICGRSL
jgi:hypothetical protein